MQTVELGSMVTDATTKVLESMFFTSILEEEEGMDLEGQDASWVAAKLTFQGDPSGSFGIGVSPASARSIAANFLGLEAEELSETQINDVIGELTNMIAGSLVSNLESNCCFALSHPEMETADFARTLQAAAGRVFQLEDGRLGVWLQTN